LTTDEQRCILRASKNIEIGRKEMKFKYIEKIEAINQENRWVVYIERGTLTAPVLTAIANCYLQVFNTQGEFEWGEKWNIKNIQKLLERMIYKRSLGERFIGSILIDTNPEENIAAVHGFCLGLFMDGAEKLRLEDMPFHIFKTTKIEALRRLKQILSPEKQFVFLRELGISKEKRGGLLQIMRLIATALKFAGKDGEKVIFWTSEKTNLYYLVIGTGAKIIHQCNDPKRHIFLEYDLSSFQGILEFSEKQLQDIIATKLRNLQLSTQQPR